MSAGSVFFIPVLDCVSVLFFCTFIVDFFARSAEQKCRLPKKDITEKLFFDLQNYEGSTGCKEFANDPNEKDDIVLHAANRPECHFQCLEGYSRADGDAILFKCESNSDRTAENGEQNIKLDQNAAAFKCESA